MYLVAQRPLGDAPSLFGVHEGSSRGTDVVVQMSSDSLCRGRRMVHQVLSLHSFSLGMEALFSALLMTVPSPSFFSTSLSCLLLFSLGLLSMGLQASYSILHILLRCQGCTKAHLSFKSSGILDSDSDLVALMLCVSERVVTILCVLVYFTNSNQSC